MLMPSSFRTGSTSPKAEFTFTGAVGEFVHLEEMIVTGTGGAAPITGAAPLGRGGRP